MNAVDYRKLFWFAKGRLSTVALCSAGVASDVARSAVRQIEDALGDPTDEAGWSTTGPCLCAERKEER